MDYNDLRAEIISTIRNNGIRAITGDLLQDVLLEMVQAMGLNVGFGGVLTGPDNPAITPRDPNLFYIATLAGTYTNFDDIVIDGNTVYFFIETEDGWRSIDTLIPINRASEIGEFATLLFSIDLKFLSKYVENIIIELTSQVATDIHNSQNKIRKIRFDVVDATTGYVKISREDYQGGTYSVFYENTSNWMQNKVLSFTNGIFVVRIFFKDNLPIQRLEFNNDECIVSPFITEMALNLYKLNSAQSFGDRSNNLFETDNYGFSKYVSRIKFERFEESVRSVIWKSNNLPRKFAFDMIRTNPQPQIAIWRENDNGELDMWINDIGGNWNTTYLANINKDGYNVIIQFKDIPSSLIGGYEKNSLSPKIFYDMEMDYKELNYQKEFVNFLRTPNFNFSLDVKRLSYWMEYINFIGISPWQGLDNYVKINGRYRIFTINRVELRRGVNSETTNLIIQRENDDEQLEDIASIELMGNENNKVFGSITVNAISGLDEIEYDIDVYMNGFPDVGLYQAEINVSKLINMVKIKEIGG